MSGLNNYTNLNCNANTSNQIPFSHSNLFESLRLSSGQMGSSSYAQSFLNQFLASSYQTFIQQQQHQQFEHNNIFFTRNFNYSLLSQLSPTNSHSLLTKQNLFNSTAITEKTSNINEDVGIKTNSSSPQNLERFNYLNELIVNSEQRSSIELEKALIYE